MEPVHVANWADLPDRRPFGATADGVVLVVVRFDDDHSVFSGRCQHRGALLADGMVVGDDLVCGLHGWDYRIDTGISAYDPDQALQRFTSAVVDGAVVVDKAELTAYRRRHPMTVVAEPGESTNDAEFRYHDSTPHLTPEEPAVARIHMLARYGLDKVGHDGPVAAMGVPRSMLPSWDSLQVLAAQLARFPLLEHETVEADVTIGPRAARPLHLELPIFVSDMSYGALSQEAKTALGLGADRAGTGICSGE
ncbi:MAG TPA: Rieske 2Fe-2S domain-containing protein, partial [Acidimicrobiales bacterium]